jgi:hypothetical protein
VSSLSIKSKISRIISEEDSRRPFSTRRIMQRLRAEGIQIAGGARSPSIGRSSGSLPRPAQTELLNEEESWRPSALVATSR